MVPRLKEMVSSYINENMKTDMAYIEKYKAKSKQSTYEEYIKQAIVFNPGHMWQVERYGQEENFKLVALYISNNQSKLSRCKSFDDVIRFMDEISIDGFGPLSKYDKALAMSILLNLMPDKIFMHAGPKEAFKYLTGDRYNFIVKKLQNTKDIEYVDLCDLPDEFNKLKDNPYLIEICLCYIKSKYIK